jgi:antitoxin (DNA-binding transcriptional repressor) of toxin-antitoxin stability system
VLASGCWKRPAVACQALTNLTKVERHRTIGAMPRTVNLYEAKSHLSALVEDAAGGQEIVIAKAGVPRARLVALRRIRRRPGGSKGRIRIAADFDAPMPEDLLDAFRGRKR